MTYAISPSQIPEFLAKTSPFDRLGVATLQEIAAKCQLVRYQLGQSLFERNKMPSVLAVLHDGRMRVLGYDRRTGVQASLGTLGAGEVLGWTSLLRGIPCETAIASTECICITLPAKDFLEYLKSEPEFKQGFQEKAHVSEVFELLALELERRADGSADLKAITLEATPQAKIITAPPGRLDRQSLDPQLLWLLSSGQVRNYPPGSRVETGNSAFVFYVDDPKGARLIGVRPALFDRTPAIVPFADGDKPAIAKTNGIVAPSAEIVPAPASPIDFSERLAPPPKYPYVRGRGPIQAPLACFQMLSLFMRVKFRRDAIRKVLNQQLKNTGEISLHACGGIVQMMGMQAQLGTVPPGAIGRLPAPAMIRWQQSFALLYSITEKEVVLAVPEEGILRKRPEEIGEVWGNEPQQVLLVNATVGTKREQFSFWWFIPSLAKHKKVLVEVFAASFFIQLFGLANPLITQVIIDKVIVQRSFETLDVLGVLVIGIGIFEALLGYLRTYLFSDTTNRIDLNLGSQIIDHLFRLPLSYFDSRRVGDLVGRVGELGNIRQFLTGTALTVVLNALFSVIYIAVMLSYSLTLTAWALVTVPLYSALIFFVSPIVRRQLLKRAERYADAQSYLVEALSGMQTVKAQTIELKARWNWYERYARFMNASFTNVKTSSVASSLAQFLNKLSGLILLWVGARMVLQNQLTLGQLIAFRIIAGNVTNSLLSFVQVWQSFQEVEMSVERLRGILNAEPEADIETMQNIPLPDVVGSVEFQDLSFRFLESGPLQLANVNLSFEAGTFVGIVGQSGSGKSTLMKLLQRLYPPVGGRIKVDGYDISKVELYSLRRQIGVVLQDTLLFNTTVKENISLTRPEATDEEVIHAAKVASAHEFIMGLPNGYNTVVGERGSSLSGGQRQRVAIARTVLQCPSLLILDEATSALDYNLESAVCRALQEEFVGRTVFFITHRLPTVRSADTIIVMDTGSVVEQGSHEELMSLRGRYYALYQQQESQM